MLRQPDVAKVGRKMARSDKGGGRGKAEVSRPTQGRISCRVPVLVHRHHLEEVYYLISYR